MNNWGNVVKANKTALNSNGSAVQENERYMESLSAKLANLKAQFEELVLGDGGINAFIKGIVDAGTAVLKFANSDLGQTIIMIGATTTAINTLIKTIKLLNISSTISNLTNQFKVLGETATMVSGYVKNGGVLLNLVKPAQALMGSVGLLVATLVGVKEVTKYVSEENKRLATSFNEATTNADKEKKSLKDIEEQLRNTKSEIADIQSKTPISITKDDKERLTQLDKQLTNLQLQYKYQKLVADEAEREAKAKLSEASTKTYTAKISTANAIEGVDKYLPTSEYDSKNTVYGTYTGGAVDAINKVTEALKSNQEQVRENNKAILDNEETIKRLGDADGSLKTKNDELIESNKKIMDANDRMIEKNQDIISIVKTMGELGDEEAQKAISNLADYSSSGEQAENGTVEFIDALDELGETADDDKTKITSLAIKFGNFSDSLSKVKKAYQEWDETNSLSIDGMADLQKACDDAGISMDDFYEIMTDTNSTAEEQQEAFDNLVGQLITTSGILDGLTLANSNYIQEQLEANGVANAGAIVNDALAKQINAVTLQANGETKAFSDLGLSAEQTAGLINVLRNAKVDVNGVTIITSADIANLNALQISANAASDAIYALAQAKILMSGGEILEDNPDNDISKIGTGRQKKKKEEKPRYIPRTGGGGAGSSGGGGGTAKDPVEEAKKQAEEFKKLHKQILDDRLKYLDHELKQEVISVEEHNDLKQRAYGQYFSALSSMGIDYLQEQNEFFDEQREWQQKRFEDSIKYEQHLIDRQIKALQKQKDEESDGYEEQIDRLEEKRDKIVDALDEEIDLREEQKDAELDAIKEEQDAIKKKHDEVINNLKDQIDILKEEKSANKEAWDERIAQLDAVNDELEKQKQLEEKLEALAKARATRVKVFKNGRFVYDVDREAVSEAQKNLNEYKEKLRQERAKKSLQDQRDAEQKNYDERIDALEKYKDQQDKYYDEIEDRLDDHYDAVDKKYTKIIDALKKQRDSEKKLYDDKIKNLQKLKKEQEKEYQDMIDDLNDLKDSYSDALEDMENVQNGFLDATKAFTYDYSKSMEENLKAFMEYVTGVKDGYKELEQAKQEYKNSSSESERLDEGADDYTNIKNYSDPSQQHEAWEKAGSPSSSSYQVPSGDSRGSTSSLVDKYGGIVTNKTVTGHASGIASIGSNELAIVGENPNKEIVVGSRLNNGTLMSLNRGTGVINAKSTRTLAGLVNSIGSSNNLIDRNTSVVQTFSFDKIVLPNVTNANSFVEVLSREFNNRAIQYGNIRR